jgi:hypothetical protein
LRLRSATVTLISPYLVFPRSRVSVSLFVDDVALGMSTCVLCSSLVMHPALLQMPCRIGLGVCQHCLPTSTLSHNSSLVPPACNSPYAIQLSIVSFIPTPAGGLVVLFLKCPQYSLYLETEYDRPATRRSLLSCNPTLSTLQLSIFMASVSSSLCVKTL